ncbi:hypothetical protein CYY_004727 [Polysphondylium violaceum]|uniref:Leucine-rich repeat-containing protein n=1 Tax=Polysphondylium violaceum TaxID=133409 RepID=A0A8J4V4W3_9MYCE|nr:hypothetical protein CYY_004727 [Polysphondylium violaceum]
MLLKKLLSFRNNSTPKNTLNGQQDQASTSNTATAQKGSFFKISTPRGSKGSSTSASTTPAPAAAINGTGIAKFLLFEPYQLGATEYYASHKNLYDFPPQMFVGGEQAEGNSLLCYNPSLSTLILDFNNISSIPDSITLLCALKHLSIAANQLTEVPECIAQLKHLVTLELGMNRLTAFPVHVCSIGTLVTLYIESNSLTSVPAEIAQLAHLKTLSLTGNALTAIPAVLPPALEVLNLGCNDITDTASPALLAVAATLTTLNLAENAISTLDASFSALRHLRTLVLDCNMIEELDGTMAAGWESIVTLNMAHNMLACLPPQLALLPNLKVLDVRGNRFEFIKKESPEESSFHKFTIDNFITDKDTLDRLRTQKSEPSCNISVSSATPPISELSLDENKEEEEEELSSSFRAKDSILCLPVPIIISDDGNSNTSSNTPTTIIDNADNADKANNISNNNNNSNTTTPSTTITTTTTSTTTTSTNNDKDIADKNGVIPHQKLIIWQSLIPDLIIDRLYLGCRECSINKNWLKEHNITHILTIAHFKPLYNHLFKYKCIDIDDVDEAPIGKYFKEMNEFIDEGRKEGGVLIHCRAGVSRSASATIAYIMYHNNVSFQEAFDITSKGRPRICPNRGFVEQLKQFEQQTLPQQQSQLSSSSSNIKTSLNTSSGSIKEQ